MLPRFLLFCFLYCSTMFDRRALSFGFTTAKINFVGTESESHPIIYCFYDATGFKMLTTDITVFVHRSVLSTQFQEPLSHCLAVEADMP